MAPKIKFSLPDNLPNLPRGWYWKALGELVDQERGICYGIVQPGKHDENGIPMVNSGNILAGTTDIEFKVAANIHKKFKRSTLQGGEILLTLVGANFGKAAIAPDEFKGFNCARPVGVVPVVFDPEYVVTALQSSLVRHYLDCWANTTAQPTFNLSDVANLPIAWPPEAERVVIKSQIGSLDRKIQLSQKTNQTLEKMAQALFQSWFVDFDPVIDKAIAAGNAIPEALQERAQRRQQQIAKPDHKSLADNILQLFPSEFEETGELGWVPKGWTVKPVGKVIENVGGGTPKTKEPSFWDGGIHSFCTPKDMSGLSSKVLLETERHLTDAGVAKISSGILPIGMVLMSSRAPIGYLAITKTPVSVNQGIIALKPNEKYCSEYLICWAEANMDEVTSRANGSTFLEISKKNFRDIPFLESDTELLKLFTKQASAFFKRITGLQQQVNQLEKLRDTLLPKLISGELRIPEAQEQLEEALA